MYTVSMTIRTRANRAGDAYSERGTIWFRYANGFARFIDAKHAPIGGPMVNPRANAMPTSAYSMFMRFQCQKTNSMLHHC